MSHFRIERIRELFIKLKQGYDWCQKNEANKKRTYELFDRSEFIFKELESLGVSRSFSATLFIFGIPVTDDLVNQFNEEEAVGEIEQQKVGV